MRTLCPWLLRKNSNITRHTGRIQIRVLTYCQAISTEIVTDSLKI